MGAKARSQDASDREKWDKIFNGLVKMLQSQQEQLQTLVKERKILEDRLRMQQERWESNVSLYEDHVSQMKRSIEAKEMECLVVASKAEFLVGMKQRESSLCKWKLEEAEDLLGDFRVWFDFLTKTPKDISQRNPTETNEGVAAGKDSSSISGSSRKLEGRVRGKELEYQNTTSGKISQISTLLSENKFAWNQYNHLESRLTDKVHSKYPKLKEANKKIEALVSSMEELKSSNTEKDQIIERLTDELSQKEADLNMLKSRIASVTPMLTRSKARGSRDERNGVKKVFSADQVSDNLKNTNKGSRGSKRKVDTVVFIDDKTPSLFTSTFKVPKLKSSRLR